MSDQRFTDAVSLAIRIDKEPTDKVAQQAYEADRLVVEARNPRFRSRQILLFDENTLFVQCGLTDEVVGDERSLQPDGRQSFAIRGVIKRELRTLKYS